MNATVNIGEARGRKPKYDKPSDLRARIDAYFEECKQNGDCFPDYAGMRLYCKLSKSEIEAMIDPEQTDNAKAYSDVLDWARDRRESYLARKMVKDPKVASGCKAALAMPENGGYTDKPMENMDRKLHVKVSDEDAELFK